MPSRGILYFTFSSIHIFDQYKYTCTLYSMISATQLTCFQWSFVIFMKVGHAEFLVCFSINSTIGRVTITDENCVPLLSLANSLEIADLKKRIATFLSTSINRKNAIFVLTRALEFNTGLYLPFSALCSQTYQRM